MEIPFLKKKEPEKMPGRGYVPTERIRDLASKGFTEPDIIDVLRREGFSADEIDKGLTQVLKAGVVGEPSQTPTQPGYAMQQPTFPPKRESTLPTLEQIKPVEPQMPTIPEPLPEEYYEEAYSPEEYIDYIIKERMDKVDKRMEEFKVKFNELYKTIEKVNDQLSVLTKKPEELQILMTRTDSLKEAVDEVVTRLSSLERAFKDTLPALIESVRALSDLVQTMKKEA